MIKSRLNIKREAGLKADCTRWASLQITHDGHDVLTLDATADAYKSDLPKIIGELDVALIRLILTGHQFRTAGLIKRIWMAIKWNG